MLIWFLQVTLSRTVEDVIAHWLARQVVPKLRLLQSRGAEVFKVRQWPPASTFCGPRLQSLC